MRRFTMTCVAAVLLATSAQAQAGSFNDYLRRTGFGWSDGYHVRSQWWCDCRFPHKAPAAARPQAAPEPLPAAPAYRSPSDTSLRRTGLAR